MTEQSTGSAEHENFLEALKATNRQFEDEYDDLETIIAGDIGFHSFFIAEGDDPTRGTHTAIYHGIYELMEEVSVDADIVEFHHGDVTPETVWKETRRQMEEYSYIPETMLDPIEDKVKKRVRKNLKKNDHSGPSLGDFE